MANRNTEFPEPSKGSGPKSGKSRYRLAQFSGLDEAYLLRLESGERQNPSRDTVMKLGLALVADSTTVSIHDVNELLWAGGYAPLKGRGEALPVE